MYVRATLSLAIRGRGSMAAAAAGTQPPGVARTVSSSRAISDRGFRIDSSVSRLRPPVEPQEVRRPASASGRTPFKEFPRWLKHPPSHEDGAVLRIQFTTADATKLRVVVLGVVAELQLSFSRLHQPGKQAALDG